MRCLHHSPSRPTSFFIVLTNVFGIIAALHSDWRTGAYVVQVREQRCTHWVVWGVGALQCVFH